MRERAAPPPRRRLAALVRALRAVIGAPDYEAYLAHCRRAGHPPRLSEREYVAEFFARRAAGRRCC